MFHIYLADIISHDRSSFLILLTFKLGNEKIGDPDNYNRKLDADYPYRLGLNMVRASEEFPSYRFIFKDIENLGAQGVRQIQAHDFTWNVLWKGYGEGVGQKNKNNRCINVPEGVMKTVGMSSLVVVKLKIKKMPLSQERFLEMMKIFQTSITTILKNQLNS